MLDELIEKVITEAMEDPRISKKTATAGLLLYMCGHGTVDDFKDVINYTIKNQKKELKKDE